MGLCGVVFGEDDEACKHVRNVKPDAALFVKVGDAPFLLFIAEIKPAKNEKTDVYVVVVGLLSLCHHHPRDIVSRPWCWRSCHS